MAVLTDDQRYSTWASYRGVMDGIEACLSRARDRAQFGGRDQDVSAWSVGEHLEHVMLADRALFGWIGEALTQPNPASVVGELTELGERILMGGSITRGRGPAPEFTIPAGMDQQALVTGLTDLQIEGSELEEHLSEIDRNHRTLPHHVLGRFTPKDWLRFLHIHHDHHDAIMRDILAQRV